MFVVRETKSDRARDKGPKLQDGAPGAALGEEDTSRTSLDDSSFFGYSSHHRSHLCSYHSSKEEFSYAPSIREGEDESISHGSFAQEAIPSTALQPLHQPHEARKRQLSFSTVEIQEYALIPGDNPAVTKGVPLSIGWEPSQPLTCSVEDYEAERVPRSQLEMQLPASSRYALLKSLGYERPEIMRSSKSAAIVRNQRKGTSSRIHLESVTESIERLYRATKNATWCRAGKQKEQKWLRQCMLLNEMELSSSSLHSSIKGAREIDPLRTLSMNTMATSQCSQTTQSTELPVEEEPRATSPDAVMASEEKESKSAQQTTREQAQQHVGKYKDREKEKRKPKKSRIPNKIKKKQRIQEERLLHNLRMLLSSSQTKRVGCLVL